MKGQNRPTLVAKEPYYPGGIGEDLGVVGGYKYRIVCVRDRDIHSLRERICLCLSRMQFYTRMQCYTHYMRGRMKIERQLQLGESRDSFTSHTHYNLVRVETASLLTRI